MNQALYTDYIQKSYTFLFPLLELPRKGKGIFMPAQTYLRIAGGILRQEDCRLIVSYPSHQDSPLWDAYQQERLLGHPRLENMSDSADGSRSIFIFDLNDLEADLRHFHQGQYSKLSMATKKQICSYYGINSAEWAHVEGFLYPEKAYRTYARELGVDEQLLRADVELCPPFDKLRETLSIELPENFVELMVIL